MVFFFVSGLVAGLKPPGDASVMSLGASPNGAVTPSRGRARADPSRADAEPAALQQDDLAYKKFFEAGAKQYHGRKKATSWEIKKRYSRYKTTISQNQIGMDKIYNSIRTPS